jgi:hypothetical protein
MWSSRLTAGLPENRIRVLQLGEHADYAFPRGLDEAERALRSGSGPAERWTTGASVTVELPAGTDCSRAPPR